jgi:hypothetical protein
LTNDAADNSGREIGNRKISREDLADDAADQSGGDALRKIGRKNLADDAAKNSSREIGDLRSDIADEGSSSGGKITKIRRNASKDARCSTRDVADDVGRRRQDVSDL